MRLRSRRRCLARWALLAALVPASVEATVQTCGSSGFYVNGNPYSVTSDASACDGEPNGFSGLCSVVAGGVGNNATGTLAMIAGGSSNVAAGEYSNVNGGTGNTVNGSLSVVGGGSSNSAAAEATHAVIAGGYSNYVGGENGGVASGSYHVVTGIGSFVGGGSSQIVSGSGAFVGGGSTNTAAGNTSTVAGGQGNRAAALGATISGGALNAATDSYATAVGGYANAAEGGYSAVAGGSFNVASGQWSFIAAGWGNRATAIGSATLGSMGTASHEYSAVLAFANETCLSNGHKTVSICAENGLFLNGERIDTVLEEHAESLDVLQANATSQDRALATIAGNITMHGAYIDGLLLAVAATQEANMTLSAIVASNRNDLDADIVDLTDDIVDVNSTVTINQGAIAALKSDVDNLLESNVSRLWGELQSLDDDVVSINGTVHVNQGEIADLESDVAAFQALQQSRYFDLWTDVQNISDSMADLQDSDVHLVANISRLSEDLADAHSRITELNGSNIAASLRALGIGVTALETNVSTLDVSVGSLADSINTMNVSLQSLQTTVSQLNSTTNLVATNALEVDVAVNREVIADLVANDSLLVTAVSKVAVNLELLRGNMDGNISVSGLARGVDALNGTLQLQQQALASADTNIGENRQQLNSLHGAVQNHSTQIEWLMENVTTQDAQILRLDAHLSNHLASAQSLIDNLTSTVSSQKKVIEGQASTIAALNATTEEQQHHIERLESTINDFNATLSAVMVTIEQLSTATTFADVVETTSSLVNCADDTNGPCSTTVDTETTDAGTSTTFASPTAALHVCYYYPCDEDGVLGAVAWTQDLIVVASVDAEALEYSFTLESDKVHWEVTQDHAATSFVPSEVRGLTAGDDNYTLRVSIKLTDNSRVETLLEGVQFAGPPVLHSIDSVLVNSSAAVNWFDVTVNASDRSPLTYDYWVTDTEGVWSYVFASNASENIRVTVPSTRDVLLRVIVTNADLSSTSCNESCPLLEANHSVFSSQQVFQNASLLLGGGSGGDVVAAFVAGIDSASNSDELQLMFNTFVEMSQNNDTLASDDIFLLHEFVHAGVPSGVLDAIDLVGSQLGDATDEALDLFLETVDGYGSSSTTSAEDALSNIADLDKYLSSVCVSLQAGSPPNSEVLTFKEDTYSLSCSSSEAVVDIETDGAALTTSVDQLSTASLSEWNATVNSTDGTELLSGVYGFNIDSDGEDQEDAVDVEDGAAVIIAVTEYTESARKAVSCKYFDETNGVWSERGVVLLGLALEDGATLQVICSSSHFTLFGVGDESEAAQVLESKFTSLAGRVDQLNTVDLADPNAVVNMSMLSMVGGVSAVFVVAILVGKVCGRKAAAKHAAVVFEQ